MQYFFLHVDQEPLLRNILTSRGRKSANCFGKFFYYFLKKYLKKHFSPVAGLFTAHSGADTCCIYINRFLFCVPKENSNVADLDSSIFSSSEDLSILWTCQDSDIHLVLPQGSGSCRHHLLELTVQVCAFS